MGHRSVVWINLGSDRAQIFIGRNYGHGLLPLDLVMAPPDNLLASTAQGRWCRRGAVWGKLVWRPCGFYSRGWPRFSASIQCMGQWGCNFGASVQAMFAQAMQPPGGLRTHHRRSLRRCTAPDKAACGLALLRSLPAASPCSSWARPREDGGAAAFGAVRCLRTHSTRIVLWVEVGVRARMALVRNGRWALGCGWTRA